MASVSIAKVLTIRDCGFDEYWLRDRIFEDPAMLGLGELQAVGREKVQSSGGRLDLLLKNPEDDSMFEVELQLGATDETHIIRTIEYWDNEKRRWPNRSHTAVLVAEEITNRFFNVAHLLSLAIPIIGIQVQMVQIGESKGLHFTKIIDSYEEPEDTEGQRQYDERHWVENYPGTLECAKWYKALLERLYGEIPTKYFETYLSFSVGGVGRVWISKRKNGRAFIDVKFGAEGLQEALDFLNSAGVSVGTRDSKYLTFNVNLQQLEDKAAAHQWVASKLSPSNLRTGAGS